MDCEISFKNPEEFFSTNMLIDLNIQLWQDRKDNMLIKRSLTTMPQENLMLNMNKSRPTKFLLPKTPKSKPMPQPTTCPS